ncbi:hypothetical protein [Luteimonas notoginsengisoli]|uniref:Uncharacterized protein n=1 Tax=Luteimonas notoginsengisoli TaxID=1578200 RepID=A0ABV7UQU4_9GAMM
MLPAAAAQLESAGGMLRGMTPDQTARLAALEAFMVGYRRKGKTYRQFWDEFWAEAGDLYAHAEAAGPDSEISIALYDIVESAGEGFSANPATIDDVME